MSILKLKDSQGNWIGVPTIKGDRGNGISSAVLNNDYTLTLTFTDGTTYTTPSIRGEKGERGEPATDMDIHICSASEYDSETRIPIITSPDDKTFYLVPTEDGTSPDLFTEWVYVDDAWEMFGSASIDLSGYLTDVAVNGISVVTDGVAEIPIGGINRLGAVQTSEGYGIKANNAGILQTNQAISSEIKNANNKWKPIVPNTQHESTFYGLAKAAGHDEKDSTLSVGQYTDEAKTSIKNMLGVQDSMVVNATLRSGSFYSLDKTYAEIGLAVADGTNVVIVSDGKVFPYAGMMYFQSIPVITFGSFFAYEGKLVSNGFIVITDDDDTIAQKIQSETTIPTLTDVQINRTSIVDENGVANVPIADLSTVGAFKTAAFRGLAYDVNGFKIDSSLTALEIKAANKSYKFVPISGQHISTFYGLAKASGDTTQSQSSNAVGNYTDNAKDKIQTMLGVSPLIAPHESDPFESAHTIGELFIINGKLYRAKTALTAGEYINEGTNVEVVDVAEVLDDTYVKNTDIAGDNYGLVKVKIGDHGLTKTSNGFLQVYKSSTNDVKGGTNIYRPITPYSQHESVFYGLAKASGDSTQSTSDNPVGTYTEEAKASIQTMLGVPSSDDVVNDVQINGSSVVTDGVAEIPLGGSSVYGVYKASGVYGVGSTQTHELYITSPTNADIKNGTLIYKPITPSNQHQSVFYGLTKAAGVDMSSSSNAVGTYTDEAKTAIKQMLGVHDTYDSFIEEVTGTDVTITGQPSYRYNCGEVLSLSITPPSSGTIDIRFTSGSTPTVLTLPQTVKMPEWWVEVEANTIYEMCITDGIYCGVMTWAI